MKILFKACPRCGGDLHNGEDIYGQYNQCLQCGHIADLTAMRALSTQETAERKPTKTVGAA